MEKEHVRILAKIFLDAVDLESRARDAASKSQDITKVSFTENDVKVNCKGKTYHFSHDEFHKGE